MSMIGEALYVLVATIFYCVLVLFHGRKDGEHIERSTILMVSLIWPLALVFISSIVLMNGYEDRQRKRRSDRNKTEN